MARSRWHGLGGMVLGGMHGGMVSVTCSRWHGLGGMVLGAMALGGMHGLGWHAWSRWHTWSWVACNLLVERSQWHGLRWHDLGGMVSVAYIVLVGMHVLGWHAWKKHK